MPTLIVETLYPDGQFNNSPVDEVPELDPRYLMTSWIRHFDRDRLITNLRRDGSRTYEVSLDRRSKSYEVDQLIERINGPISEWTLLAMRKEDYWKYYLYDYRIFGSRPKRSYVCLNCGLDDATVKSYLRPWIKIRAMTRNVFYRRDCEYDPLYRKCIIEIIGTRINKPLPPWVWIEGRVIGIREPGDFGDTLSMECSNDCRRGLTWDPRKEISEFGICMEDGNWSDGEDSAIGEDVEISPNSSSYYEERPSYSSGGSYEYRPSRATFSGYNGTSSRYGGKSGTSPRYTSKSKTLSRYQEKSRVSPRYAGKPRNFSRYDGNTSLSPYEGKRRPLSKYAEERFTPTRYKGESRTSPRYGGKRRTLSRYERRSRTVSWGTEEMFEVKARQRNV